MAPAVTTVSTASIACSPATMRIAPAGLSRLLRSAVSSCSISSRCGLRREKSCSPAGVGTTLRVVRVNRRTSNRASSLRIAWLSADCETPSCAAARVKLRSRATTIKESRSLKLSFSIAVLFMSFSHVSYLIMHPNAAECFALLLTQQSTRSKR